LPHPLFTKEVIMMQRSSDRKASLSLGPHSIEQRLSLLLEAGVIDKDDLDLFEERNLRHWGTSLTGLAENVIGAFPVPLGIATHFVINGEPRLIPMATEERSVIAAASKAAKLCLDGFKVSILPTISLSHAQILYADILRPEAVYELLNNGKTNARLLNMLRKRLRQMDKYGGGLRKLTPKLLPTLTGRHQVVIDLSIDTGEAMGANVVTKMAEAAGHYLRRVIGASPTAVICSNHESGWNVFAQAEWTNIQPAQLKKILAICEWAWNDQNRACTHNKGIMNAVTAIALATGQDTRAIEASCHSGASRDGMYKPFSSFLVNNDTGLHGRLFLRLPVGTIGGATSHPMAVLCRKIMGVNTSAELACVMAAAGLAQNFGALRALADEGIPESHRRLAMRKK
jgi:hydroxymethylglutaryl-CoA reductase